MPTGSSGSGKRGGRNSLFRIRAGNPSSLAGIANQQFRLFCLSLGLPPPIMFKATQEEWIKRAYEAASSVESA
jgi:hypothetical protein